MLKQISLAGLALFLVSCAGTEFGRLTSINPNDVIGIPYYEPANFVLVYSDGKGALNHEFLVMPDLRKPMYVRPYAYFASNNATLSFTDGVLTSGSTVADASELPAAVIKSIGSFLSATSALDSLDTNPVIAQFPPPALFRVVIGPGTPENPGGISLLGDYARKSNGQLSIFQVPLIENDDQD